MTKDNLKKFLREYVESITSKSKGNFYNCPLCKSGTGKNKTGAFKVNGETWTCYSCNNYGDIFELIGKVEGLTNFNDKVKRVNELYGNGEPLTDERPKANTPGRKTPVKEEKELTNYSNFFLQANKDLSKTTYYRGLSIQTLNHFRVGYVKDWINPTSEKKYPSERLIIPTSQYSYLARAIDPQNKYKALKVGTSTVFNQKIIEEDNDKPISITEGEIDAMSVYDVGGNAIGLGSTANIDKFIFLLEKILETKPAPVLVLMMDNDKSGEKATKKLAGRLQELKIKFVVADFPKIQNPETGQEIKDANELLQVDRPKLQELIEGETKRAEILSEQDGEELRAYKEKYIKSFTIPKFLEKIMEERRPAIKTGFRKLDEKLNGGLREGLYIIGAMSSVGKTTFTLQIADKIAEQGQDVLFFSLEMSEKELTAKSISRISFLKAKEQESKIALGTSDILWNFNNLAETEQNLIFDAIADYGEYSDHIATVEGVGNIGVSQIREQIREHIYFTGNTPVVIIDYLQILAPYDIKATDKQNTDKSIVELKRLSRDLKTPVIVISSMNRESYSKETSMKSFKESGGIEYGADVLIGLQLKGIGEKEFDEKAERAKYPRNIEMLILKNRNGESWARTSLDYYTIANYFTDKKEGFMSKCEIVKCY